MDSLKLVRDIKKKATEFGFDLVGITTPDPPDHYDIYQSWIQAGYQGEMEYLANPRAQICRANPKELLAECQSIIILAARYPNPCKDPDEGILSSSDPSPDFPLNQRNESKKLNLIPTGRVAAYAWGKDYHGVLKKRMKDLAKSIAGACGKPIQYRVFTDSAPILERDLAQRAGLGWVGKNSCLINPKIGSFFFLGEILLDIPLPPDDPFTADFCGKCNRCIQACPTHCILPDRTLDARRCISYLTIELKNAIPDSLRLLIDDWVFGCDLCQIVCPWNNHALEQPVDPVFQLRMDLFPINLAEVLQSDEEQFRHRYPQSPLQRAKWRGLARNTAIVLGNRAQKDPQVSEEIVSILARALRSHPDGLVRQHIVWSLQQIDSEAAKNALRQNIQYEQDETVLSLIRNIIGVE